MEIFKPNLTLSAEPDGEFTLDALTLAPNSCYSARPLRAEPPPNVRLVAEVYPVILPLRARRGLCLQALTPVRHRARNIRLGPKHGKTRVMAFVMLDGQVLGSASIAVPDVIGELPRKDPPVVDTSDWYAWVSRMPPGPPSFHVIGNVHLPTPGYEASLLPAAPQGINPAELILDLRVTERPGVWPQVVTTASVRYDLADYTGAYQSVLVREPDGDAAHLSVEEAF